MATRTAYEMIHDPTEEITYSIKTLSNDYIEYGHFIDVNDQGLFRFYINFHIQLIDPNGKEFTLLQPLNEEEIEWNLEEDKIYIIEDDTLGVIICKLLEEIDDTPNDVEDNDLTNYTSYKFMLSNGETITRKFEDIDFYEVPEDHPFPARPAPPERPAPPVRPASNEGLEDRLPAEFNPLLEANSCPICFELFFRPMTLPCGHTFCEGCLTIMRGNVCPTCRTLFNRATPLKENNTIRATCDLLREKGKASGGRRGRTRRAKRAQRKRSTRNKK